MKWGGVMRVLSKVIFGILPLLLSVGGCESAAPDPAVRSHADNLLQRTNLATRAPQGRRCGYGGSTCDDDGQCCSSFVCRDGSCAKSDEGDSDCPEIHDGKPHWTYARDDDHGGP